MQVIQERRGLNPVRQVIINIENQIGVMDEQHFFVIKPKSERTEMNEVEKKQELLEKKMNIDTLNGEIIMDSTLSRQLKQTKMTVLNLIEKLSTFLQNPKKDLNRQVVLDFIGKDEAQKIKKATQLDTEGMQRVVQLHSMRHIMNKHSTGFEKISTQIPVVLDDFTKIPKIVANGMVSLAKGKNGLNRLEWQANIDGIKYLYYEEVRKTDLALVTLFKQKGI